MSARIRVLVVGDRPTPEDRSGGNWTGAFTDGDVDLRSWTGVDIVLAPDDLGRPLEALSARRAAIDLSPLEWSDVLEFRGTYLVTRRCLDCAAEPETTEAAADHAREAGHLLQDPTESLVAAVFDAIEGSPDLLHGRAVLYAPAGALGRGPGRDEGFAGSRGDRAFVDRLARRADLIVASDADEARTALERNDSVRVAGSPAEWAAAYRWAAEHAGWGAPVGFGPARPGEALTGMRDRASTEARAGLAHRQRIRAELLAAPMRLEELRAGSDVCWPPTDAIDPLVSIVIPVGGRVSLPTLMASVASARIQSHARLEILVICVAGEMEGASQEAEAPETEIRAAIDGLRDARCRVETTALPGSLPDAPTRRQDALEAVEFNVGLARARGAWIAPLPAGALFTPDHVATLLDVATSHRLELVYGQALLEDGSGTIVSVGTWPPARGGVVGGSELVSSRLASFGYDGESWRQGDRPDWARWRLLMAAGVRMANVEQPVLLGELHLATPPA